MGQARCVRVTTGKDHPSAKRHTEKKRKAHHTMKHMQKCPRTPSHEVCPCTHTPLEPPDARQGIKKERYPPPNKPPSRSPHCRPTTHVRILWRKEAWYSGTPVCNQNEGTTRHRRAHHRHKTHVPQAPRGTRRARGMPAHIYMPPQTMKGMDVHNKGHRGWRHMQRQRAQQPKKPPPLLLSRTCTPYGPPPPKKMWTPPKNTRRTRGHLHRRTE